jgi:hypothetical protein
MWLQVQVNQTELKSPKAPSRSKWLSKIRAEIASFSPPKVGLTGQVTLTASGFAFNNGTSQEAILPSGNERALPTLFAVRQSSLPLVQIFDP